MAQGLNAWGVVVFSTQDKFNNRHRLARAESQGRQGGSSYTHWILSQGPGPVWGRSHTVMNVVWVWLMEH